MRTRNLVIYDQPHRHADSVFNRLEVAQRRDLRKLQAVLPRG